MASASAVLAQSSGLAVRTAMLLYVKMLQTHIHIYMIFDYMSLVCILFQFGHASAAIESLFTYLIGMYHLHHDEHIIICWC